MSELLANGVADWLAAQVDGLAVGTDLFVGQMPEDAGLASGIKATGGVARGHSPTLEATFQIITRDGSYAAAFNRADALYRAIYPAGNFRQPVRNAALSDDWLAVRIDAIQPPFDLGLSDAGMFRFVFNITVTAARLSG